jgi:ubiquitin-conjugating enzyme E2 variant
MSIDDNPARTDTAPVFRHQRQETIMFIVKLLITVVMADFVSGLVHWLEDAYARPDMRLFGKVARDNLEHHARPRAFLKKSWWESSWDILSLGLIGALLAGHYHVLTPWVITFVALVVNANQIHKWAHSNRQETPRLIRALQRYRILQTPREHARHHSGERNTHYCAITNFVNPALELIGFWKGLEHLIKAATGVSRRNDAEYLHS